MTGVPGVELREGGSWDTLEHLLGEDTQQLPANVEGFVYWTVLVASLLTKTTVINVIFNQT